MHTVTVCTFTDAHTFRLDKNMCTETHTTADTLQYYVLEIYNAELSICSEYYSLVIQCAPVSSTEAFSVLN